MINREPIVYIAVCIAVFLIAYILNALIITVGYHRALAHGAVSLHPVLRRMVITWGNWFTGLDPKAWSVMHRMHHAYSDTDMDPHSPHNVGVHGILTEQLRSYKRVIVALLRDDPKIRRFTKGLDFELNALNRHRLWWLPYALHGGIALTLAASTGMWLLAAAYFVGMMSHPLQGGLVNALGHALGGRNFSTNDDSRNNNIVAWLVAGEGYQNNHHAHPSSAKFSFQPWEVDWGYGVCLTLQAFGLLEIDEEHVLESAGPDAPQLFRVGPTR